MSGLYRFPLFSAPLHHVENLKYLHHFRVVERWWRSGGEKFEMLKTRKQQSMSTANRVIKNTGYLYAKMGITMFVSLYTTRLILNSLGASDFGIFNIVGGAIAMLGFLNAAMASATQRFMSYAEGEGIKSKQKSIFNVSFVLHILISLLVGIALLVAGYFFFNGILNIPPDRIFAAQVVYGSLIISTMFTVMTVPYDAVMNAHENMLYYAIVGIIEAFLKLAVAFACVYTTSDKLIVYGILMACIPLITLTIMRVYCHKHYEECTIAPKKYFDKGLMKEMTSFAGWNFLGSASSMIGNYGQGIILNSFFGTILNAAQGIAAQINGQIQVLASNMLKALNPVLGKSAGANNKELLLKSTLLGAKYSTVLYTMIALPIIIETPNILQIWLHQVPEWTIIFVRIQLIRSFIEFQFCTLPSTISASGKIRKYSIWSSICNFLQLPSIYLCFYIGLPPYSMYLVAIICGNLFVYAGAFYFIRQLYQLSLYTFIKEVQTPLYLTTAIAIVPIYCIKYIMTIYSIITLFIYLFISIIIFILLFYSIGCNREEKQLILKLKQILFNKIKEKL